MVSPYKIDFMPRGSAGQSIFKLNQSNQIGIGDSSIPFHGRLVCVCDGFMIANRSRPSKTRIMLY